MPKGKFIPYSVAEMAWLEANRMMVISDYHRAFFAAFGRADVSLKNLHALRKRKRWATGRTGCFEKGIVPHNRGVPCAPGTGGRHPNAQAHQFQKGNRPHNTNYLGHERISVDGYVEVSVAERNPHTGYERRYVLKHRWLWERINGPVPEGFALKCLDDNKLNTDPENWEAVPRAILPRLNGGRRKQHIPFDGAPAELKPAIMAVAKLAHRVRTVRKST